jgi:glutaminyl-peptide cyclotransferase
MNPNRRKKTLSRAFRGADAVEPLEPRLLPSAAVGPHSHQLDRAGQTGSQPGRLEDASRLGVRRRPPARAGSPFDGERAFGYLEQVCALGPRPAGSASNASQRRMVAQVFAEQGATVREQPFSGVDPLSGARVDMVNLIGSWHPERTRRVVIAVHCDTRPFPDQEPDPGRRRIPYLGANDGGSGVALLMELAHHMNDLRTSWGVDLVLLDAEELVYDEVGEYSLGAKEFAREYAGRDPGAPRYVAGLVLDMVGDEGLTIDREQFSLALEPRLVRDVWSVAHRLKAGAFRERVGHAVVDDHLPLTAGGIPTNDIIDFRPPPTWHTASDLPEHCSARSLEQVGKVVTAWLSLPRARR